MITKTSFKKIAFLDARKKDFQRRIYLTFSLYQVSAAAHLCPSWPRSCSTDILDTGLHAGITISHDDIKT